MNSSSFRRPGAVRGCRRETDQTDPEIVRRISSGDLSPLAVLYDRHHEPVRRFLVRATASEADAEDLTHEVFLVLTEIAGTYDGRPSARPFLLGIAGQLVRRWRRRRYRDKRGCDLAAVVALPPRSCTPEDVARVSEELHRIDHALLGLSEEKRFALLLIAREEKSGQEAADMLGIPVKTVWTRVHYARCDLRRSLAT
jgi:RNA polymerase sigma-70 factor (ECF subfamily)